MYDGTYSVFVENCVATMEAHFLVRSPLEAHFFIFQRIRGGYANVHIIKNINKVRNSEKYYLKIVLSGSLLR